MLVWHQNRVFTVIIRGQPFFNSFTNNNYSVSFLSSKAVVSSLFEFIKDRKLGIFDPDIYELSVG